MPRTVYLDYNATTPLDPEVRRAMMAALALYGNPSSAHAAGRAAHKALEGARESVAASLGARPSEIVFTSGGTESNNLAVIGAGRAARAGGRGTVLATPVEHPSVTGALALLAAEGSKVVFVPVDGQGLLDENAFEREMSPSVGLAVVQWAQNEVGTVQPVARLARIAAAHNVPFFTDAVQAAGKVAVRTDAVDCALLSIGAHKIYGPKGAGVLFVRAGTLISPFLTGGHQEGRMRPGTQNVAGAVALATALARATSSVDAFAAHVVPLREQLWDGLVRLAPGVVRNGAPAASLPNTLHVSFPGRDAEGLVIALDLEGIAVSAGAACASGAREPSAVLCAMGIDRSIALGSVRFSLGRFTTAGEIRQALGALRRCLKRSAS